MFYYDVSSDYLGYFCILIMKTANTTLSKAILKKYIFLHPKYFFIDTVILYNKKQIKHFIKNYLNIFYLLLYDFPL